MGSSASAGSTLTAALTGAPAAHADAWRDKEYWLAESGITKAWEVSRGANVKVAVIDATGKPKNKKNVAETAFEKKAVEEIQGGKTYVEEVGEKDGKPVFRAGTVVPAVMSQCAVCHGGKEGRLLGAIVYEVPIK